MRSYRDLEVWQKAMDLVVGCYHLTRQFPNSEIYGFTGQIRRAAVSVPANIAEGHARNSTRDFLRHLSVASGSLVELETHLLIAQRLALTPYRAVDDLLTAAATVGRMLHGLKRALRARLNRKPTDPRFPNP